jgi:hypothetical protein
LDDLFNKKNFKQMKKILFTLLVSVLAISACKDDSGEAPAPLDPLAVGEVAETNKSLAFNFSATYCGPCLNPGSAVNKEIISNLGDNGYFIKMHADGSYASVAVTDEATEFEANAWNLAVEAGTAEPGYRSWPSYGMNAELFKGAEYVTYGDYITASGEKSLSYNNSPCKANVGAKFMLEDKKLTLKYKLQAFQGLEGRHRVAFYVVENDQVSQQWGRHQEGAEPESLPITHPSIIIGSLNGTFGEDDINSLASGETLEGTLDYDLKDMDYDKAPRNGGAYNDVNVEPNLDNIDIFAVIFDGNSSNYKFVNISKAERVYP